MRGNQIRQYNVPERIARSYALRQSDPISHGILLETIRIAASEQGCSATLRLFPDRSERNCIALIELNETGESASPLCPFIAQRVSNRKPYWPERLRQDHRRELIGAGKDVEQCEVRIIEDAEKIAAIAQAASLNERLGLENPVVHATVIGHLRFTEAEHEKLRDGLYIKTLEMPPAAEFAFRYVFRHWPLMGVLGRFGIPAKVAAQLEALCRASAAYGAVLVRSSRDEDFIAAGCVMQRVWLTATKCGVSLQPTTGPVIFMQRLLAGERTEFTAAQQAMIRNGYERMSAAFGVRDEQLAMVFRLGYGDPPSARSLRYPFEKVVQFA